MKKIIDFFKKNFYTEHRVFEHNFINKRKGSSIQRTKKDLVRRLVSHIGIEKIPLCMRYKINKELGES